MAFFITLVAYLTDKYFGEFNTLRHPVMIMGDYIKWFETLFYKDSVLRGTLLTLSLTFMVGGTAYATQWLVETYIQIPLLQISILGLIASTTIAAHMLYHAVQEILTTPQNIAHLVSRDTQLLSSSDIHKAAIETYAENLSDGVIAPLFYLLLFGLTGAFVYKAINTLDSMVGYRNERYEKFGKFSAKLDDVVNYIPSRLTALLIALLMGSKKALLEFYSYGKKHDSPNAGHPISAMALAIGVKLGGDTVYFEKVKKKAFFGEGKERISVEDIERALKFRYWFDLLVVVFVVIFYELIFL